MSIYFDQSCFITRFFLSSGQISSQSYLRVDVRYRHASDPDQGSVLGRHFAKNVFECIKLCQWTGGK